MNTHTYTISGAVDHYNGNVPLFRYIYFAVASHLSLIVIIAKISLVEFLHKIFL